MAPAVERPIPGSSITAVERCGKCSAVLVANELRGAMQVARTRVVAEARPQMQHFVGRRIGQRTHIRESAA